MTLLAAIVETSSKVAATSARLAKVRELAACIRQFAPEEIVIGVAYLSGETPQGKFGIGYAVLKTASAEATAAEPTLSVLEVDRRLTEISELRGTGSTNRRAEALSELFSRATEAEQHFLMRLLIGELRQGALAGVMVDAVAAAAQIPVDQVRRAAMYAQSLGAVAHAALIEGESALANFQLELLSPVAPMLAQTAADPAEALEQLGEDAVFEWKMDGARIQVHKSGDAVHIYTRSLNDVTAAVPEIAALVRDLPASEVILDGEAIAFTESGRPHPFQVTMRRFGRKLDVEKLRAELPMRAYFFDCLRLGDESLADRPTRDRYEALARAVPKDLIITRLVTASEEEASAFYDAAIAAGHEGIMAKSLSASYEAGNRGASWLKIKRAHTLDLVVLAAEWGHGRRTGKLSNLHLGALDPATGEYVMLGKTFKGLTDAMLEWQTKEFLARETGRDDWTVYVRPELVVEIAFSDLQASPRYPGGLALRLARVKRYRDDKRIEDADTMESVRKIFEAQSG
ncbi:ATP-dependent DNA ligase [Steroidobacter sp.]|uniref:ATP-dependent DNA ligase n=1 Tax=Steroidobacter sp. TaxID=1978227 RepID=UPI001A542631|nr:ATP-dependent DNA ligase [Steroidobacter sp.]MBL8270157.1 ATP-dependent DNA ligase [Steroidobacter sp.]